MSDPEPKEPSSPSGESKSLFQQLAFFTERFGHMMSRLILTVLYFVLVAPAGLVVSLFGDPLRIRKYTGSSWNPWGEVNETLPQARRQD